MVIEMKQNFKKKYFYNKKGMMKLLEVFIAAIITFTFVLIIIPPKYEYSEDLSNSLLREIERDDIFRKCALDNNITCLDNIIRPSLFGKYSYNISIFDKTGESLDLDNVKADKINIFTTVISGNYTNYDPKVFKLYYWIENT